MTLPFHPDPAAVRPEALAGRYRFVHDGWTGTLVLDPAGPGAFTGTYHDDRHGGDHEVRASLGGDRPHRVELVVLEFNWMTEQRFDGWLFTQGQDGMAGRTSWQGEPFGFFARKTAVLNLDVFRSGRVRLADLQGRFRVVQDGVRAVLELDSLEADAVSGRYWFDPAGPPLPARATLGGGAPCAVQLTVGGDGDPVLVVDGLLFSRDKNAVAGSVQWQGERYGCYLVRLR